MAKCERTCSVKGGRVSMRAVVIIPARMDSTRLPGKPLIDICGKTLMRRCYESVLESGFEPWVATSDDEIIEEVKSWKGKYVKTSLSPRNGTERVAEACNKLKLDDDTIVVNCQGDMFGWQDSFFLTAPICMMNKYSDCVVTVFSTQYDDYQLRTYDCVKVLQKHNKIDFSRTLRFNWNILGIHFGLYVARKYQFDEYSRLERKWREVNESLEQLRWECDIRFCMTNASPIKIDTLADVTAARLVVEDPGIIFDSWFDE